jgi:hypothetical protein
LFSRVIMPGTAEAKLGIKSPKVLLTRIETNAKK